MLWAMDSSSLPEWEAGEDAWEPWTNSIGALVLNVGINSCSSCLLSHTVVEACQHWSFKSRKGSALSMMCPSLIEQHILLTAQLYQHFLSILIMVLKSGDMRVISFMMSVRPKLCKNSSKKDWNTPKHIQII